MIVKFKKLSDTAIKPFKAHKTDAAFDLFADEDVVIGYGETKLVQTNIAIELPYGYVADVRPRSGMTLKTKMRVNYGTIDSGYRGSIGIICENSASPRLLNDFSCKLIAAEILVERGDKIAQLVIQKLPEIELLEEELEASDRGVNGFGSTGSSK